MRSTCSLVRRRTSSQRLVGPLIALPESHPWNDRGLCQKHRGGACQLLNLVPLHCSSLFPTIRRPRCSPSSYSFKRTSRILAVNTALNGLNMMMPVTRDVHASLSLSSGEVDNQNLRHSSGSGGPVNLSHEVRPKLCHRSAKIDRYNAHA